MFIAIAASAPQRSPRRSGLASPAAMERAGPGGVPKGGDARKAGVPTPTVPFVGVTPCRIVDTRGPAGAYGGPSLPASFPRTFDLNDGPCPGIPPAVEAYSLNVTVTNTQGPGFILINPTDGPAATVSTLNYAAGQTIANAAVVPAGTNGNVDFTAGVSGTDLIVDINGYYAGALITGVIAGTGLSGGGTSGNVTLDVVFGGGGMATAASRSDHDHFGQSWSGTSSTAWSSRTAASEPSAVSSPAPADSPPPSMARRAPIPGRAFPAWRPRRGSAISLTEYEASPTRPAERAFSVSRRRSPASPMGYAGAATRPRAAGSSGKRPRPLERREVSSAAATRTGASAVTSRAQAVESHSMYRGGEAVRA